MRQITRDDFHVEYSVLHKFPRVVQWMLDRQITINNKTYLAKILQRQDTETAPMSFYPSVLVTDIDEAHDSYAVGDPISTEGFRMLEHCGTMNEALTAIMAFITKDVQSG